MKKTLLIITIFLIYIQTQAQVPQLWGTMTFGGFTGEGIFHMNGDGTSFAMTPGFTGRAPGGNLLPYNGELYGTSSLGGTDTLGDIFKYNTQTDIYTSLFNFDSIFGSYPHGSLFLASNGKMYGLTHRGGLTGKGTLFSLNPATNAFAKVHDFDVATGGSTEGNVTEYNNKLYGMTSTGGINGTGVLFSFNLTSNIYTVEYNFSGPDFNPYGSLLVYNNYLYGMSYAGGAFNKGTIFRFDPANGSIAIVHNLQAAEGTYPYGSLCLANNGIMYGLTGTGGTNNIGTIFSFDPTSNSFNKLHDFVASNGKNPNGSLMQASDGHLYGTTYFGGTQNQGAVFSYDITGAQFTKIHDCMAFNNMNPNADLLEFNGVSFIPDFPDPDDIKIISNPVHSTLQFSFKESNLILKMQIFTNDGKMVIESSSTRSNDDLQTLSVNNLVEGNYFLMISTSTGKYVASFVKQ
ncbi:MAG: choice-of-anchor tandem repeat GloVer-containing protein [Bacteroidota bacterium]